LEGRFSALCLLRRMLEHPTDGDNDDYDDISDTKILPHLQNLQHFSHIRHLALSNPPLKGCCNNSINSNNSNI
jgi:hypothetical protein